MRTLLSTSARVVLSTVLATAAVSLAAPAVQAQEGCNATTWNLTAGQTIDVGSVTVSSDATNIYVNYTLDYQNPNCPDGAVDATFGTLHVWIGNSLLNVPANPNGTPVPGQFCSAATGMCFDATGLTTYTFVFSIAELEMANYNFCNQPLYVVTHAEVNYLGCDGLPDGTGDTAFGGDTPGSGPRWWFYGQFTPNCTDCNGGGNPVCGTSYAKGGYVWTTDRRSNPERLPSLNLTQNRWGWAINLTQTGTTTYEIWEGAGLNKTCTLGNRGAVMVGTLTVNWDGTNVDVCYSMLNPAQNCGTTAAVRTLDEVHIYAGDDAPTMIAPGQYGFIDSFEPGVSSYCATLPLADANGGGVWVVAHAVTCYR